MLQIVICDILSTLLLIFFLVVRPMVDGLNNVVQFVNELVVLYSVWFILLFTAFVPQPEIRYDLANYFLYIIGIDCCLNVLVLLFEIFRGIYNAIKTAIAKRKAKKK